MASSMDKLAKELKKQITASDERKPKPYDTQAEVLRVENGVAWVHIPGGVDETPVRLTINAKKGDNVNLHVANGTAWITGNSTNPPTDDSTANYAVNISNEVKKDVTVLNTVVAENIEATNARFTNVEADTAKIHDLTADNLHATVGYIEDLTADNITTNDISAASGYIKDLEADNVTANDISAASGYIKDLTAGNVTAQNVIADHATVGSLDANYAKVNAANINTATIRNAWVDKIMVQTGLLAYSSQIYTLDAIEVNAANITAGTLDVNRLIVTVGEGSSAQKYLVNIDPSTGTPSYEKLDGNIVEPRTITANKIVANSITTDEITVNNLVGTSGWINLHEGKFFYGNGADFATSANAISWNGSKLQIKADEFLLSTGKTIQDSIESVENWFYSVPPTTSNPPANSWTTTNLKEQHLRDIYFDTTSGKSYRWSKEGSIYKWVEIEDVELAALAKDLHDNYPPRSEFTVAPNQIQAVVTSEANARKAIYGTCGTATGTTAKVVTCANFARYTGAVVTVKFTNANTATTPTLNVNSTGAATIKSYKGDALAESEYKWAAGSTLSFVFDGTYWRLQDSGSTAQIKVNADNINLRVQKNDVINQINVSTEGAQIQASKVDIAGAAVFNSYSTTQQMNSAIGTAVDGIEVGGKNLFCYGSDCQNSLDGLVQSTVKFSIVTEDGIKCAHISGQKNGTGYLGSSMLYTPKPLEWFTFSAWAKLKNISAGTTNYLLGTYFGGETISGGWRGVQNVSIYVDGAKKSGDQGKWTEYITDTNWHYLVITAQYQNYAYSTNFRGYVYARDFTGDMYVHHIKWERGTKATDWTPAPEDVQAEIDAKKNTHVLMTGGSGTTYARILGYASEGTSTNFSIDTTATPITNVKIGDSVRLAYYVTDMGEEGNRPFVYINGTVAAIPDATHVTLIGHGLDTTIIDGGNILTNSITALQIDTGAITADELATDAVIAGKIKAGAVTASKLAIGDFNNYITVNENNEDTLVSGFVIEDGWLYKNVSTSSNAWLSPVLPRWGNEGDQFRVTGKVKTKVSGRVRVLIYGRTADGTANGSAVTAYVTTAANTEKEFSGTIKISSVVAENPNMNIVIQFVPPSGTSGYIVGYCKEMRCERIGTYITQINENGIRIHPAATEDNSVVINASGMEVFKGGTESEYSVAKYGDTARVGKSAIRHIEIGDGGLQVYQDGSTVMAHLGYGSGNAESGTAPAPYFVFGMLNGSPTLGNYSVTEGSNSAAVGVSSHAEGGYTQAIGHYSHAEGTDTEAHGHRSHAEGHKCYAGGFASHAEGEETVANGDYSHAAGRYTTAGYNCQTVIGVYNQNKASNMFEIGNGDSFDQKNIFEVDTSGNVNIPSGTNYKINGVSISSTTRKTFTPTSGASYSDYGGCYYEKYGNVVHVHVGVSGLTANTATNIATLPAGYRPHSTVFAHGTGGSWNNLGYLQISKDGVVMVRSEGTYCGADVTYIV